MVAPGKPVRAELADPVARLRVELIGLASTCDIDGLAEIALRDGTELSSSGIDDPAESWRDLETHGDTPMATMAAVLHLAPGVIDTGGELIYVWPSAFAVDDWSQLAAQQRDELTDLFGIRALDVWEAWGGYVCYRVGISENGVWLFFVAGD